MSQTFDAVAHSVAHITGCASRLHMRSSDTLVGRHYVSRETRMSGSMILFDDDYSFTMQYVPAFYHSPSDFSVCFSELLGALKFD